MTDSTTLVKSVSLPFGGISIVNKVEKSFDFFPTLFGGLTERAKDFVGTAKSLIYNRLTHCVSIHQILETYPKETFEWLGLSKVPAERTFYRVLERIGKNYFVILDRYQKFLKKNNLLDKKQLVDFSSTYFEGKKSELGALGFSADRRPDKKQIRFGISTGMNNIPVALTIQKGNTQDKKHMKAMLNVLRRVLDENSLLIFDCGANSRKNKKKIRKLSFHYLTLKAKQVRTYRKYIQLFHENEKEGNCFAFDVNGIAYKCVKVQEADETKYIYFSAKLKREQLEIKKRKFLSEIKKSDKLLTKIKTGKTIKVQPSSEGWINLRGQLQQTLDKIGNPYINGLEGFFILESSVDDDPEKVLRIYKARDKAEKFIRNLKEGLELRPVRHWTKWAIIGHLLVAFLTNFIINLTLLLAKNSLVKNTKLLKNFLINLTLTVVYPENRFRFTILSNISKEIRSILGNYLDKYQDKTLGLRW